MRAKGSKSARKIVTEFPNAARRSRKTNAERSLDHPTRLKLVPKTRTRPNHQKAPLAESAAVYMHRPSLEAWRDAPFSALVSHLVHEHHRFTFRKLRRLERLLAQVKDEHARDHPQLGELQVRFLVLSDKLTSCMIREEQMLFPYILQMAEARESGEHLTRPVFGSVRDPMDVLMVEHEGIEAGLEKIRLAVSEYSLRLAAGAAWKALARGLKALAQDLRRHTELEDRVLFPRALSIEGTEAGVAVATPRPNVV